QSGEVLGETLPGPVEAFVQAGTGQVLHAFHQCHDLVLGVLADRGEADAAIAHDDGGDAVPRRRREARVPHRLAVVMRVEVDEAGRDGHAAGVDLIGAGAGDGSSHGADRGDLAVLDGDVGDERGAAIAVHHGSAADDDIVFAGHGLFLFYRLVAVSTDRVRWASLGGQVLGGESVGGKSGAAAWAR